MRWTQASGRLVLSDSAGHLVEIPIDGSGLAHRFFRHDPPRPDEIERAIDAIEDAIMSVASAVGRPEEFVTDDPLLLRLPGARADVRLGIEEIERLFQRLALAASAGSTKGGGLPAGSDAAAALLMLRETMHHFDVGSILFEAAASAATPEPDAAAKLGCASSAGE